MSSRESLAVSEGTFTLQQMVADRRGISRPQLAPSMLAALRERAMEDATNTARSATSLGFTSPSPRIGSARRPAKPSPRLTYDFTNRVVTTEDFIPGRPKSRSGPGENGTWLGAHGNFFQIGDERKAFERARQAAERKRDFRSQANELEVQVLEQLKEGRARAEPPCPIRMMVYRQLFDNIISRDPVHGALLAQIKNEYEVTLNPLESDGMKKLYDDSLLENDRLREDLAAQVRQFKVYAQIHGSE